MPIAEVETPDGKIMTLEVPEGATNEQIIAFAEANYQPQQAQQPQQPQAPAPSFYDMLRESLMGGLAGPIKAIPAFEGQVANTVNNLALSAVDVVPNLINAVTSEANRFRNVQAMDNYDPSNGLFIPTQASQVPTAQGIAGQVGIGNQNYLPQGSIPRYVAELLGTGIVAGAGSMPVATRNLASAPGALAEFTGFGSKAPLAPAAAAAESFTAPAPAASMDFGVPQGPLPVNKGRGEQFIDWTIDRTGAKAREATPELLRQTNDAPAAGFKLEPVTNPGTLNATDQALADAGLLQRAVPDPLQGEALRQGFGRADVAFIAGMNPATRRRGLEMLDTVRGMKRNIMKGVYTRPSEVVGNAVMNPVNVVRKVNKVAGENLDSVARKLEGERVDLTNARSEFTSRLLDAGVVINPKTGALDFRKSDWNGYKGAQGLISRIYERVNEAQITGASRMAFEADAYRAHKAKRFIDKQVTFGKTLDGINADTENLLKSLRHNIDAALDANFDKYNRVNTHYSTTVQSLDELQKSLGSKMDFNADYADESAALGMRKIITNYGDAPIVKKAFGDIEALARKYITESDDIIDAKRIRESTGVNTLDENVLELVALSDRFNKIFGVAPPGSLEGIQTAAAQRTADMITNPQSAVIGYAPTMWNRVRGVNEDNALKAMEQLLRGGK